MRALDIKLLRDLSQMKGQVITIALVVACGIASFVAVQGTYRSIVNARDTYYERYRFPDAFASMQRAPMAMTQRALHIPGVAGVYARVVEQVSLPVEGMAEPARGQVVGIPLAGEPALGGILLRHGRLPLSGHPDEAVVLEAFATAHDLQPGSRLPAVIAGVKRELRVVGIALAPEYVFAISPGEVIPDPRRFGVLWMDTAVVSAAFRMEGAFNELLVRLQPGASERAVVGALNLLFEPYGCLGAYGKNYQLSNQVLHGDLEQLKTMTTVMPAIFLIVAAFLINVVLSRLVQLQRPQIATLKAVGYSHRAVGMHYLELVTVVVVLGAVVGLVLGIWLGGNFTRAYTQFFHFPDLRYEINLRLVGLALGSSMLAAVLGALASVRAVMLLPPAEAMRAEPPASYRRALTERLKLSWLFGQSAQMVLREIERRPLRAAMSSLGVALAVALLVGARFGYDAIDFFMLVQFDLSEREDLSVSFRRPVDARALHELAHAPGVLRAEGLRALTVRYHNGQRSREGVLAGYAQQADLRRLINSEGNEATLPDEGILLNSTLAGILGVGVGDKVAVEVLEGTHQTYQVPIRGLIDEVFGLYGHMRERALAELLGDQAPITQALLRVDVKQEPALLRDLRMRPDVLAVNRHSAAIAMFEKHTAGQMRYTTLILTLFATVIACAVIYNNARIVLSTRGRDLASLRVLGFRRAEISAILLGELAIQVFVAIIPGLIIGKQLAELLMAESDPEMYRFPAVISAQTYSFAVIVTLGAAAASALLVRRSLDELDLVGVLKSRE